jgi:hypothetical protein
MKQIFSEEKLKELKYDGKSTYPFAAVRVEDPGLTAELEEAGIPFRGEVTSNWLPTILSWVVPVALFSCLELSHEADGSGAPVSCRSAKARQGLYREKDSVTFADVGDR